MQRPSTNVRAVQDAQKCTDISPASNLLAEALTRHDATAAAGLYAENGRLLTTGEHLVGRDQIEAYWRAGIALGLTGVVLAPTETRAGHRVAVEAGRYELTLSGMPGRPTAVERGTYLVLHRRDADGSWRRVIDLFDVDPAEVPGPEVLEGT